MKFRVRCESRTVVVEIENNAVTTVKDLKTTILTAALAHLGSNIRLSLNGSTPLEEDCTISDAGLVHGDTIHVMIPPGEVGNISVSSSSTSQQTKVEASSSASSQSSESRVDASSGEQSAESGSDCNIDQGSLVSKMSCVDADAVPSDAAMLTEEEVTDVEINRYLKEPMLIRESTKSSLPQSLVKSYEEPRAPGSLTAMAALLRVLMNELGYLEQDKAETVLAICNWTCPKSLQMNFVYPVLDGTVFRLLMVPLHGTLMVHGRVELFNNETLSARFLVAISEFVNTLAASDDPLLAFRGEKLPALSRTFKDTIAYPLLQFALAGSGYCAKPDLSTLALELQIEIMKRLDVPSLLRLSEVNQQLHDASQDRSIWRRKFIRDFGASKISAKDLTEDWKEMYKKRYLCNKAMKQRVKFWRPDRTYPPILPIGGEYDLNPFYPGPRPPMCIGGPAMFPFSHGLSQDSGFDGFLLPSVHLAHRYGHPSGSGGGSFCFRL